jgi:hypothetical protein
MYDSSRASLSEPLGCMRVPDVYFMNNFAHQTVLVAPVPQGPT